MSEEKTAIILHMQQERSRITVLDCTGSKYNFICDDFLTAGSYIAYGVRAVYGIERLVVRDVFAVPLQIARINLTFLHQVLDLCRNTIPFGSPVQEIYQLLVFLCTEIIVLKESADQHLFIAKLIITLGLQVSNAILCNICLMRIHTMSVDSFGTLVLDLRCSEKLLLWIQNCLADHISKQFLTTYIDKRL